MKNHYFVKCQESKKIHFSTCSCTRTTADDSTLKVNSGASTFPSPPGFPGFQGLCQQSGGLLTNSLTQSQPFCSANILEEVMPQHVPNPRGHILHAGQLRLVSGVSAGIDADYIIKTLKRLFFFFLINSQMCEMEFKELYIFIFFGTC